MRLPASVHFVQNDRRAHERTLLTRGSNDNPVEQTEDGRGKQTDQRPDHPLEILIRDPFSPDDFEEFITERERTIQMAIEDFLVKERVDLPPQLRELDAQIEQVELRLRTEVERALGSNKELVPRHIADKVDERLQQAVKKNAALDSEHYETLHGQLEFFDLREVQDAIMNRALWPRFESLFGSNGMLETKFGQFAELRNGIRHSRSVDEVTRKEGEAAILWFEKVLST